MKWLVNRCNGAAPSCAITFGLTKPSRVSHEGSLGSVILKNSQFYQAINSLRNDLSWTCLHNILLRNDVEIICTPLTCQNMSYSRTALSAYCVSVEYAVRELVGWAQFQGFFGK